MKFAAIVPPKYLMMLDSLRHSYHMALGHMLIENSVYKAWYKLHGHRGDFIMVDNGEAERKNDGMEPIPFARVVHVAHEIRADEIVMPDVIGDWERSAFETTNKYARYLVPAPKRVVAPHGETWEEFVKCIAAILNEMPDFATIALTKGFERLPGGRARALSELYNLGLTRRYNIHLLGAYDKPLEDARHLMAVGVPIRSIDTVAPFSYAQNNESIEEAVERRSYDWDKNPHLDHYALAYENFLTYRRVVAGDFDVRPAYVGGVHFE